MELINSSLIQIPGNGVVETLFNNKIISLKKDDKITEVGDTVNVKGYNNEDLSFKILDIQRFENNSYVYIINIRNFSYIYLLPLFFLYEEDLRVKTHLINAYISTDRRSVYFHYYYNQDVDELFMKNVQLHDTINFPNRSEIVYNMKIPRKLEDQFNLLIEGKYSKLSDLFKSSVLSFNNNNITSYCKDGRPMEYLDNLAKPSRSFLVHRLNDILRKSEDFNKYLSKSLNVNIPIDSELQSIFKDETFRDFIKPVV